MKSSLIGSFRPNQSTKSVLAIWSFLQKLKGAGLLDVSDY